VPFAKLKVQAQGPSPEDKRLENEKLKGLRYEILFEQLSKVTKSKKKGGTEGDDAVLA
jgi:hypothetical protein